jgi:hypothetical protein
MNFSNQPDPAYASMHDWMQQWTDIETRLSALLLAPSQHANFTETLQALQQRMDALLTLDADSALYWLFQLASGSTVCYSASHAMVCASLCRLLAPELGLDTSKQHSLALAALTMNIAMTKLQDDLAAQSARPTEEQRALIDTHPARGAQWLRELGVQDALWLHVVEQHHEPGATDLPTRILMATDRYAAIISPRETRPGRCMTDAGRHAVISHGQGVDEVGHALLRTVGICPPGTFVRLLDGRVAVVLRRSSHPGEPWVASVLDGDNHPVVEPELIDTGAEGCGIEAALVTQTVRVRLNHPRLLQLSRMAAARQ